MEDFVTSSCCDKNYLWTSYTWTSNSQGLASLRVLKILPKATYIIFEEFLRFQKTGQA